MKYIKTLRTVLLRHKHTRALALTSIYKKKKTIIKFANIIPLNACLLNTYVICNDGLFYY